jgi:hypothetical protein
MMSSAGDDLGAMDPGLGPAPSRDEDAAPAVWSQFLAPEPFRDVDPSLYRIETTASPAAAVEAWVTAQPLAPSDSTAALVVDCLRPAALGGPRAPRRDACCRPSGRRRRESGRGCRRAAVGSQGASPVRPLGLP